ncbi:helix-turn-helix transcriptional regulator [Henriciella sp.]|uniref:helix-turn-helix transcriptional regulator n=1 Tax=Henriciella sp. TaxID=1968823 RepID=UPI00345B92EF
MFEDQYLDRDEAAQLLGVDKRTLARWFAQGEGPPRIKIGARVLYAKASLERWLRSMEEAPCRAH